MKKAVVSVLLITSACALWAQGTHARRAQIEDKIERALAQVHVKNITWQDKLKLMQANFQKVGMPTVGSTSTPTMLGEKSDKYNNQTYKDRLFHLQDKINTHKDLKGYRFFAPLPADLATLSEDNYEALEAFCADVTQIAKVSSVEWVHPFTLSLRVRSISNGQVELWVDEPTKTIYLMADNLRTTAAGKYGVH